MGKLWGDLCENQDENWLRYNGTALYSYFMQISHVSCIWPSGCPYLFVLNTRHNRRNIFCPFFFGYCKHRFIPTQYVFMFWNRNLVFKLTTIDVPSGLRARNFQSSVIHHHEFSLIGKFNVYTCIWETLFEKPNWVIWILAGNCLTMVTSISRHDLLSWHRPHTKNIKSFCNYVTSIDVNQFGSFICYIMIDINHICFCIFIHAIKLMKDKLSVPHEEWPNLGMTDPVCWPLSLSW